MYLLTLVTLFYIDTMARTTKATTTATGTRTQAPRIRLKTTKRITRIHENVNKFMDHPLMDMFRSDMANRIGMWRSIKECDTPTDEEINLLLIEQFDYMDKERRDEESAWSDYTVAARTKIQEFCVANGPKVIYRIALSIDTEEWEVATFKRSGDNADDNSTKKMKK